MMISRSVLIALVVLLCTRTAPAQEDLNVLNGKWLEYSDAGNSLYHYLTGIAYEQLRLRKDKVAMISTLQGWKDRQEFIRRTFGECIGPFPEKTPLNARITRTINKEDYRIEHIVFESIPGFYVTSSLYLPVGTRRNAKMPAVIYCSGHSADGYRSDIYQYVILNLVNKGFIVFAFDPVGQGERLEYFDKKSGQTSLNGPTGEHSYPGAQAFLAGSSQAMYMIWDGIRAVDYLLSRKEVDPGRIGITGRSGGGTQAAYIAAFDDRIYAAAPENYITNYTRLLQTIGPQDAEQNLFNVVAKGLDHPDFLVVRAPKPALMITTSNDMFSIQGAIETEAEVAGVYRAYGKQDNFSRCEDDAGHASTNKNREAMYAFFQKHLSNPGNPADEAVHLLTAEELRVTDSGQVSLSYHGETVFSLNMKRAMELESKLNETRSNLKSFLPEVVVSSSKLSGFSEPLRKNVPVFSGRIRRNGYSIEKYILKGEGNYVIPYLLFKPDTPTKKAMIYINPDGKAAGARTGGDIESYVMKGYGVLAPDLIGTGETSRSDLRGDAYFNGASHNLWYASMLVGRSITGIRASDVVILVNLLSEAGFTDITGYAVSNMAPELLHAAVATDKIRSVILSGSFSSYLSIATHRFYNPFYILDCIPGALGYYDLPDLESALAPRKLVIEDAVDCLGTKTYSESIKKDIGVVQSAYDRLNASGSLKVSPDKMSVNEILDFLQ